jgi:hypothetical protein
MHSSQVAGGDRVGENVGAWGWALYQKACKKGALRPRGRGTPAKATNAQTIAAPHARVNGRNAKARVWRMRAYAPSPPWPRSFA